MGSRISWFPGHMVKALASLKRVMKGVDLVVEVRDARVPFSSANQRLTELLQGKRHIIVLNKADLVDSRDKRAALKHLDQQQGVLTLATNSTSSSSVKKVMDAAVSWLERERHQSELSIMMVVGLPNSGKSSIINALKMSARAAGVLGGEETFQKRAAAGPTPGLTRQVSGFQVCAAPVTYVLDTPGIMVPSVPSDEVGLRLALAGAIKDSIVGEEALVKYLLHLLATNSTHRAALRKTISSSGAGSSSSSSKKAAGISKSARRKLEGQLQRIQRALLSVAESAAAHEYSNSSTVNNTVTTPSSSSAAAYAGRAAAADDGGSDSCDSYDMLFPGDAPMWHPGHEDEGSDPEWMMLEMLHEQLGVAGGAAEPSKQLGCYVRILQAFRAGDLGKYMLDTLPEGAGAGAGAAGAGGAAAAKKDG